MSMYATSLEEHLLPDNKTLEEVFSSEDAQELLAHSGVCTISAIFEY